MDQSLNNSHFTSLLRPTLEQIEEDERRNSAAYTKRVAIVKPEPTFRINPNRIPLELNYQHQSNVSIVGTRGIGGRIKGDSSVRRGLYGNAQLGYSGYPSGDYYNNDKNDNGRESEKNDNNKTSGKNDNDKSSEKDDNDKNSGKNDKSEKSSKSGDDNHFQSSNNTLFISASINIGSATKSENNSKFDIIDL